MSIFESISTPKKEKNIPKITTEEWLEHSGGNIDDEKFRAWMEARGIEFNDEGIAEIELEGDVIRTSKDDFGTIMEDLDTAMGKSKA